MNNNSRFDLYRALEEYRDRPLIAYVTSTRHNVRAMMAADAVRELIDQINEISDGGAVDILIHSTGGDALAAWKLMSVLRERFGDVAVLVPYMAFSAATLFALGANEIVMHPFASLGPIDPQITVKDDKGNERQFSYEDVGAFLRFVKDEVGITEQDPTSGAIEKLFTEADPLLVGGAKRASELSTDVGERLLMMHMTGAEDRLKAREIAENLNKSFFAHSDAVSRSRARDLELNVAPDDTDLEDLMWRCYLGIEEYMDLRTPFEPLVLYMQDEKAAAALAPPAPINLPPDAPPQVVNQVYQQVAQNAINTAASQRSPEISYSLVAALVESPRLRRECRVSGKISASRAVDGNVKVSLVDYEKGWQTLEIPAKED
jgi:hypothetical protein